MPQPFYSFNDSRTGKDYKMPWSDVTKKPTDDDFYNFVNQENNKSTWAKLNEPLSDLPSTIARKIGEPLSRYGEYSDMEGLPKPVGGYKRSLLRSTAAGAGAWLESMGNAGDYMTSPVGIASTFGGGIAAGAGKVGLPAAAKGIGWLTQGVGAAQAAHGAGGIYNAYNEGDWQGAGQGALEMVGGGLGMRYGGYKPKVKAPVVEPGTGLAVRPKNPAINPGYMEGEFTGPWTEGEIVDESLARRPPSGPGGGPGGALARRGMAQSPYVQSMSPHAFPEVQVGPRELPPVPNEDIVTPRGPFFGGRKGTSTNLGDITETSPRAQTPAQDAFYNQIPDRYKPLSSENISSQGLRGQAPFDYVPEAAQADTAYSQGTTGYGSLPPKKMGQMRNQFTKKPTMTAAEKAAADLKVGNQPMTSKTWQTLKDLYHNESGEVDLGSILPGIEDTINGVKTNVNDLVDKIKRPIRAGAEKFAGPKFANDMSEGLLKSGWQSGWGYLEQAGVPGEKLKRLLSRARLDIEGEHAQSRIAGNEPIEPKVGAEIWNQHGDEIKSLIKQIEDPAQAKRVDSIVQKQLGRIQSPDSAFKPGVDAVKKFQAATKLSQFVISNLGSIPSNFTRGNTGAMLKATRDVLFDYKNSIETARKSGALGPLESEIMRDIGESGNKGTHLINKFFGIDKSEEALRSISALGGRSTAKELFDQLKKNPGNKRARIRLDDLILEDVDGVMRQGELTPKQLDRASARMAEITQGRAETIDLPPMWSGHPVADLATQFKRYGFAQTRNMKEAFKKDPIRTGAAIMTAFPMIGEIVGDAKSGIGGAVKGSWDTVSSGRWSADDVKKEVINAIQGRGEGLHRYGNDLAQSWAFGMLLDGIKAAGRGGSGVAEYVGGPTLSDISHGLSGAYQAGSKGNFNPLLRESVGKIPYVGTAIANQIKATPGRTSSGRSSRGRSGGRSSRGR